MAGERDSKGRFIKGHKQLNKGQTHFKKGMIAWNKGTKGIMKSNETSFKKGEHRSVKTEFKKAIKRGPLSEETKRKISIANIGKKTTFAQRKKNSEAHKGIKRLPFTEETKKRMRISTIKRIERQKFNDLPLYPSIGKYEKTIIDNLERIFGYKIIRQKRVAEYFIDGYCPMLNLAIEIDESYHKNKIEKDLQREQNIINEMDCSFLRLEA